MVNHYVTCVILLDIQYLLQKGSQYLHLHHSFFMKSSSILDTFFTRLKPFTDNF